MSATNNSDMRIAELEQQLAAARQEKQEREKFETAVANAARDELTATYQAMVEIEQQRHAEAMTAIKALFEAPQPAVPAAFAGA